MGFLRAIGTHDKLGSAGVDILLDLLPPGQVCPEQNIEHGMSCRLRMEGPAILRASSLSWQKHKEPKLRSDLRGSPDQPLQRDSDRFDAPATSLGVTEDEPTVSQPPHASESGLAAATDPNRRSAFLMGEATESNL